MKVYTHFDTSIPRSPLLVLLVLLLTTNFYGQSITGSVPIELKGNLIFVDVFVNSHKEPLHFLFDTGAGITVVDASVSARIGLLVTDTVSIGTAGKSIASEISGHNRLRLGEKLTLDSIEIAIMDLSHISKYLKTNVDGVIGNELLQNFVTETNIDDKEMRFYAFDGFQKEAIGTPYELTGLESGHLGVSFDMVLTKNSSPIAMLFKIDSGADNYFTFHNEAVVKHKLLEARRKHKSKQGFGVDATVSHNLEGKVYAAKFGGEDFRNIPVVFEVDPLNISSKRLADGLVGQAVLLKFNITYNLSEGLAYFEKRK